MLTYFRRWLRSRFRRSIPSQGEGWQMRAVIDQAAGQIGIELFSDTPIAANDAGSLVNIVFHKAGSAPGTAAAVQLVSSVSVQGENFETLLADGLGALIVCQGLSQLIVQIL